MQEKGPIHKAPNYSEFVFFSAGPVGDHALIIDYANRFFESTEKASVILMKHPNSFLKDMAIPYLDHISYIGFSGLLGKLKTISFAVSGIWIPRCYVLVLPIPPPTYLKVFSFFIRFFTRSRMVALDSLCGFSIVGGPFPSGQFVGKGNFIPAHVDTELYYEQANRMLVFLGYRPISKTPTLAYIETPAVLQKYKLTEKEYIVFHVCSSHIDRSFPSDRWQRILREIRTQLPDVSFVFTGAPKDITFIEEVTSGLEKIYIVCGAALQELLTIHAAACLNVTVHTGNAMLINMLHVPTVTINIKGVYMFKYYYNEKGVELVATEGCTCHPLERGCSMVEYKDQQYMACLFNIKDEHVIETVLAQYKNQ